MRLTSFFVVFILLFYLHLPASNFKDSAYVPERNHSFPATYKLPEGTEEKEQLEVSDVFEKKVQELYTQLNLKAFNLGKDVFKNAYAGFSNLKNRNLVHKEVLTIIDFDKPSTEKRLWIIDVKKGKLVSHTLVAHGKNSGGNYAEHFSNTVNSKMSSLGFFITGETYSGKHGLSLRLKGVETGYNSNAGKRAIVIHGADYVTEDFIKCNGRLGRSFGCPAVPQDKKDEIIETIKNGSVLFISKNKGNLYKSDLTKFPEIDE